MKKLILLFLLIFTIDASASLKLPAIFGDNMMLQQNTEVSVWGWADAEASVSVMPSWTKQKYQVKADAEGKWTLKVQTPVASKNLHRMVIQSGKDKILYRNILIGEVWLCLGQSNMEMPMKGFKGQPVINSNEDILRSKNPNIRIITVKRTSTIDLQEDFVGKWEEATPETIREFSATGYYFGRLLNEMTDTPVGLILSSWGGTWIESWMHKDWLTNFPEIKIPHSTDDIKVPNRTATTLFNGMINPIKGYSIRGGIMYQGESNYDRPKQYPALFKTFVQKLREVWQQGEFPFFYCQIAPYNNPPEAHGDFNAAFLREAQYKASKEITNSGMVVLMDVGEEMCIHPSDKRTGGERLGLMALGKVYGQKGFAYESPELDGFEVKGNIATLSFANAPMWLTSYGKDMKNFEVAGADKVFYPAKAKFNRSKVEVWSDQVNEPVAVRYGFKDFVEAELFSTEGLPVSSFRTDNWDE